MESLPCQEKPALLVIVEEPTRNIRVLWVIEKLPFSYANRTALDGHIAAFSRNIVAGNTPPNIAIDDEWWNLEDHLMPPQLTAASKINKIRPEDTGILQAVSVLVIAWMMPVSSGRILLILEAAVSCGGMRWSSRFHHSSSMTMVGDVLPATMSQEKATMWPLSTVLLAYEKGSFSMPQRTLMWRVGSLTTTRRAGLSWRGKDAMMFILNDLVAPLSSWRSKIAGYAAKEFVFSCLLHLSAKVASGFGRLLCVLSSRVCS